LRAEVEVYKDRPLDWLRNGPGRETGESPGWTGNARARTGTAAGEMNVFEIPGLRGLMQRMLEAVEAYPEVRCILAEVADGMDEKR
jgi:hypothetical protein